MYQAKHVVTSSFLLLKSLGYSKQKLELKKL